MEKTIDGELCKAIARAKVEAEQGAEEIDNFKKQYAQWISEFGDDIKIKKEEEKKTKSENCFIKFLKKLYNTVSYD